MLLLLVIAGAAGGGSWLYDQRSRARQDADAASRQAEAAEAARQKLEKRVNELEAEKSELAAVNEELSRDVQEKEGELAALKGTAEKLEEQMKAEIAKGDIRLSESGGKLRVDLVDKILFESGEAQVSKRGEEVLARVGAVLAQIDDKQVQVSGHTDNQAVKGEKLVAQFPSNWELSAARAINVVRFLTEKAGVPPQRLVASGYGEYHPIGSNKTASGRARNRRIEILLTPLLDPKLIAKGKLPKPESKPAPETKGQVAEAPAHASHAKKK
jgi:chemotaxis protein MotB